MSEFSAEWLALREPVDHVARSKDLAQWVLEALPRDRDIKILDLACGTGSNLRYLRATLKGSHHTSGHRRSESPTVGWLLVDEDAELLARVPTGDGVATRQQNLAGLTADLFQGQTVITASALLDLVSAEWLQELAFRCGATGAAALFALTYDGRMECAPVEPEDAMVRDLVNRHQRTDKGFGPALGPGASAYAADCFAAAGYEVRTERSDWVLDASTPDLKVGPTASHVGPSFLGPPKREREGGSSGAIPELQRKLIDGWADAAGEIARADAKAIDAWRRRRLDHVDAGRSRIVVGHSDLAAVPK
jgi:hypothetical protein